jgi:hypothetical protein
MRIELLPRLAWLYLVVVYWRGRVALGKLINRWLRWRLGL